MAGWRALVAITVLAAAIATGGCDKCGNRLHLSQPAVQHVCGETDEAR